MKTKANFDKIDFKAYLERYFEKPDAITALPTEAEMREMARKAIVKEQLILSAVPEGTCAMEGDTLTISTVSELPKFNKPRVTVSIGRGLYDKTLEEALIGKTVGESCEVLIKELPVKATVLEIKCKVVPEPTDEMVAAMQAKDFQDKLIITVADYEAFIIEEKTMSTLSNIEYYVMEPILETYTVAAYDEKDIRILGELEADMFRRMFKEREGIDLDALSKDEMQEKLNVDSLEDFVKMRYEWYKMKIQQCLVYSNILGVPLEGKYDPTSRYEVLSDLSDMAMEHIKQELIRRNA